MGEDDIGLVEDRTVVHARVFADVAVHAGVEAGHLIGGAENLLNHRSIGEI